MSTSRSDFNGCSTIVYWLARKKERQVDAEISYERDRLDDVITNALSVRSADDNLHRLA